MLRNALRLSVWVMCLSIVGAGVCGAAEKSPSILEMQEKVAASSPEVSEKTRGKVKEAKEKLKAGDPYAAKEIIMRLERFNKLNAVDYKLIEPVHKQIDKALGEDRKKVAERIRKQLEQEEYLSEYTIQKLVKEQLNKKEAQARALQAKELLYKEHKPEKAMKMAEEALLKGPDNSLARRVLVEAKADLGIEAAERETTSRILIDTPHVMLETMQQEYARAKHEAREHFAKGEFEQSVAKWRKAQTYVNTLSVYTDMQKESEVVKKQLKLAEEEAKGQRRKQAKKRKAEAEEKMEEALRHMEEAAAEKEAEALERAWKLKQKHDFDEAQKIIRDLKYQNPASESAQVLDESVTHDEHVTKMDELSWRHEKERLALIRETREQATPYAKDVQFPKKRIWQDVISNREHVPYPSRMEQYTEEEIKQVVQHLDKQVSLEYEDTALIEVIQFLQEITDVNFAYDPNTLPTARITLAIDTSLRNALDQISKLAGIGWEVDGAVVRIADKESVKDYHSLVYDVRDLMLEKRDYWAPGNISITSQSDREDDDDDDTAWSGNQVQWSIPPSEAEGAEKVDWERDSSSKLWGASNGGGGETDEADRVPDHRMRFLIELIMKTVYPNSWARGGVIGSGQGEQGDDGGGGGGDIWDDGGGGDGGNGFDGDGGTGSTGGNGIIYARSGDPGSLIIYQTSKVHEAVQKLLTDLRRAQHIQVNVEARFLTVSSDFFEEIGFQWDMDVGDNEGGAVQGGGPDISIGGSIPTAVPTGMGSKESGGLDINFNIFDGSSIEGFFRMAQMRGKSETLACPIITLMNGQHGYLQVATTENYVRSWETDDGDTEPDIEVTGDTIQLDVRPVVSADRRFVYLELAPIVQTLIALEPFNYTTSSGDDDDDDDTTTQELTLQRPRESTQRFRTTVCVPDRGILMVGGLTDYNRSKNEQGPPILNKIPLLKRLFLSEGKSTSRSTLLILMRPRIIMMGEEEQRAF
ncbi:MAG: hypothetical protein ACLFWL_11995 [Candidatus Brocadiia bacterium]